MLNASQAWLDVKTAVDAFSDQEKCGEHLYPAIYETFCSTLACVPGTVPDADSKESNEKTLDVRGLQQCPLETHCELPTWTIHRIYIFIMAS